MGKQEPTYVPEVSVIHSLLGLNYLLGLKSFKISQL